MKNVYAGRTWKQVAAFLFACLWLCAPATAALLTVTGHPTAPTGKTLRSATLTVVYAGEYTDGTNRYPRQWDLAWDSANDLWKPAGTANGTTGKLPGQQTGEPAVPNAHFTEKQVYTDGTSQTRSYDILIQGAHGEWAYPTVPANARYVTTIPGVPINTAWANVKADYGGVGDSAEDDSGAFSLANTAVATNGGYVYVQASTGSYKLSSDVTLGSKVTLFVDKGGIIQPDSGKTLTLTSAPIAGDYQIFDLSAGGSVSFGQVPPVTLAEWFGTGGTALTQALAVVTAAGGGWVRQGGNLYNTAWANHALPIVGANGLLTTDENLIYGSSPYGNNDTGLYVKKEGSSVQSIVRAVNGRLDITDNNGDTGAAGTAAWFEAHANSPDPLNHIVADEAYTYQEGEGTLGSAYIYNGYAFQTGTGLVTDWFGLNLNFGNLSGANYDNVTGILIGDIPTGNGTNYSIHTGTAPSWFNARVDAAQLVAGDKTATVNGEKILARGTDVSGFGQLNVQSTNSYSSQIGGKITFGGKYNSAGVYATFGQIEADKSDAGDGTYVADTVIKVQTGGAGINEAFRLKGTDLSATFAGPVSVTGPLVAGVGQANLRASTSMSTDVGASVTLQGKYTSGGSYATFGQIKAGKTNSTDSNSAGYLSLLTQTGSTLTEGLRIKSDQVVLAPVKIVVGSSSNDGFSIFQVDGVPSTGFGTINIRDTSAMAQGVGGSITGQGRYTGSTYASFGKINFIKTNGTDNDSTGQVVIQAQNGSALADSLTIEHNGIRVNSGAKLNKWLYVTSSLDFGSGGAVATGGYLDLTVNVTGAQPGDAVQLGIPGVSMPAGNCTYTAWVSSSGVVTIRFGNNSGSGQTPTVGTFTVAIPQLSS